MRVLLSIVCWLQGHDTHLLPARVSFGDRVRPIVCRRCGRRLGEVVAPEEERPPS